MLAYSIGGRQTVHGFDLSQWQRPWDLSAAVGEGHSFAINKASEGESFRDPAYRQHVTNADRVGLCHGAYHFARPDWSDGSPYEDGRQEARLQLSVLADSECFIVLDLEASSVDAYQTTRYMRGWIDQVIESGRFPLRAQRVIYVGYYFTWAHAADIGHDGVLWLPNYPAGYMANVNPAALSLPPWASDIWPEGWSLWQYSSSGTVAGLHPVDVNVATTEWFSAVAHGQEQPPQTFAPQHDGGNPAMWIYWMLLGMNAANEREEAAYRLIDVPVSSDAPLGLAWKWIEGPVVLGHLAFTGRVNAAVNIHLVTDGSAAFDALWASYPVIDGPSRRPIQAAA